MKKYLAFILFAVFAFSLTALAQEAGFVPSPDPVPAPLETPAWLGAILDFIRAAPYVGPVLETILKYMGFVAVVMTVLATSTMAVLKSLEITFQIAGMQKAKEVVQWISDKVLPVLQYLSIYNVQKKK